MAAQQPRAAAGNTNVTRFAWLMGLLLSLPSQAPAAWLDAAWPMRRAIDVVWDAERGAGDELAQVEFYSDGQHKPTGDDFRIATEDGRLLSSRVLSLGPGDRVRIAFALQRQIRRYYVYWGHPNPPPPPTGLPPLQPTAGLLLEMKQWPGGPTDDFRQVVAAWERARNPVGAKLIDRPFLGLNPFGEAVPAITRVTGSLFAPVDGEYFFAASAANRGALYLQGRPLIFVPFPARDVRFNARIQLRRGRHDFVFYHVNPDGDGGFSVVWRRPDAGANEIIPRTAFGVVFRGQTGILEEIRKTLVADLRFEYLAESFAHNNYTHRCRFVAQAPKAISAKPVYEWDFGDGQAGLGPELDRVYVLAGVYPVRLTIRVGGNSDTRTFRIPVHRAYEVLDRPPYDEPLVHSKLLLRSEIARMPLDWLPHAVFLHLRARQIEPAMATAQRLAEQKAHSDPGLSMQALGEVTRDALAAGQVDDVLNLWERVPQDARIQPGAARQQARHILWWTGNAPRALKAIEPFSGGQKGQNADRSTRLVYAHALVLAGKTQEGQAILSSLPAEGPPQRQAAISGAMARTTEFFIGEGDWEAGEEQWEKWQAQYPAEFLEGYSILLRVKLMEVKKVPVAAAAIAEAFALAVPRSSYAPQLLDRASRLLATANPPKSQALRQLLKQKYPEDPLSQDGKQPAP